MTGVTPGGGQIRNTTNMSGDQKVDYGDGGFMGGFFHAGSAVNKVREIILNTHPDKVKTAGDTYTAISNRTYTTLETVHTQAQAMVQSWSGKDAEACLKQMQKMYDQAYEIYDKSTTTGSALTDHATKLQWYKDHVPGGGAVNGLSGGEAVLGAVAPAGLAIKDSIFGSSDDNAAKEFMQHLQQRTTEANDAFPNDIKNNQAGADITTYKPNPNGPGGPGGPGNFGGGGGGGGGVPKDPFGTGKGSHLRPGGDPFGTDGTNGGGHVPGDPFGTDGGGHAPGDPFGSGAGGGGTSLAGFDPSGGGGLGGGGLGAGGGFGGDPLGGGSALGGANPGGLGAGGLGGGLGAGTGAGAGGAGMAGRGMMPMAPGHGQGEKERERSTWLTEDEDVWGGDDDAAPPLIG